VNADDMIYMGSRLIFMVGLPRAGKSTAIRRIREITPNAVVVSKDSIRLALHGQPFIDEKEPEVHTIWKAMIKALLYSGHRHIILDGCFHNESRRKSVERLFPDAQFQTYYVPTSPDVCRQRAIDCGQDYLLPVIDRMESEADKTLKVYWANTD